MTHIPQAWAHLPFFTDRYPQIATHLAGADDVLPPAHLRFAALSAVTPADVRVVILGQDPYPTAGHGNGLAFSVNANVTPLPRSLGNIFKELQNDLDDTPTSGDLSHWAAQGVLLLNTALSVREGQAGSHAKQGWEHLAREVLDLTSQRPTAYILWGRHAQGLRKYIGAGDHLLIETSHPSPLSARRGFFGSRPFSQVNDWLRARDLRPIDWIGKSNQS
ncbi:Uracil-DNA glycosylase [Monaibacterium marinum]|uniref:Uracil-DNA glycosylase n=1 Tax=Pontivivens marinum TaxID=1690039 RepID=A0A2C9CQK3_9RHOB|nr:uracil-DNA glycosylase [Monaibacterium marinum]SOH93614.1 Uracil-DNA glycosylase [Monaibacterium marinum]